jgi:hypothetical protein
MVSIRSMSFSSLLLSLLADGLFANRACVSCRFEVSSARRHHICLGIAEHAHCECRIVDRTLSHDPPKGRANAERFLWVPIDRAPDG